MQLTTCSTDTRSDNRGKLFLALSGERFDAHDFLDRAVTGVWHDSALELLKLCQKIEVEAGRPVIHSSRESRVLDIDIILFGNEMISLPELIIPHPRARQRRFVLEPLAEIAHDWQFPDSITVASALERLQRG